MGSDTGRPLLLLSFWIFASSSQLDTKMLCPVFAAVLVVGLGPLLAGAFPQAALKKSCRLSQYGSPAYSELAEVLKFKKYYVSTDSNLGLRGWAESRPAFRAQEGDGGCTMQPQAKGQLSNLPPPLLCYTCRRTSRRRTPNAAPGSSIGSGHPTSCR